MKLIIKLEATGKKDLFKSLEQIKKMIERGYNRGFGYILIEDGQEMGVVN